MLGGYPPFYDENPIDIYRKITAGYYEFPSNIGSSARDLIRKMIEPDVSRRLGNMKGGAEDIKTHPWFKGVDWAAVNGKKIPPPWVPEVKSHIDH